MTSLGVFLLENWSTLEADFAVYYEPAGVPSLPLAVWGPEPLTIRRFEVLVRNLPDESQTVRAIGGYRPGKWHNVEELLALLIETVFEGHRLLFAINSKKGRRPPDPLKVPRPKRPGEQTPGKRQSTTEELLAVFGHSKNKVIVRYTPKEEE